MPSAAIPSTAISPIVSITVSTTCTSIARRLREPAGECLQLRIRAAAEFVAKQLQVALGRTQRLGTIATGLERFGQCGRGCGVGNQGVDLFKTGEADQGFLLEFGRIHQRDHAAGTADYCRFHGRFQRIRGAQPEAGVDAVGSDESDVRAQGGELFQRPGADARTGQAADPPADHFQLELGAGRDPESDGYRVRNDQQVLVPRDVDRLAPAGPEETIVHTATRALASAIKSSSHMGLKRSDAPRALSSS